MIKHIINNITIEKIVDFGMLLFEIIKSLGFGFK